MTTLSSVVPSFLNSFTKCDTISPHSAYNPKSNNYVRNKYKKKLAQFEETCQIIGYLSSSMRQGYREPDERAIDFQHKMHSFLKLKRETQAIAT